MREIKFRAWDGEAMISPDYIDRDGYGHWKANSIPNSNNKLMQFTGLIDMDNKEIYEGDIVKVFNTITGSVAPPKRITWNSETARFNGLSLGTSRVMKVVGNIYENPELVNAKA